MTTQISKLSPTDGHRGKAGVRDGSSLWNSSHFNIIIIIMWGTIRRRDTTLAHSHIPCGVYLLRKRREKEKKPTVNRHTHTGESDGRPIDHLHRYIWNWLHFREKNCRKLAKNSHFVKEYNSLNFDFDVERSRRKCEQTKIICTTKDVLHELLISDTYISIDDLVHCSFIFVVN